MKIGLVGLPGVGKSTVFGALTGLPVETGYGAGGGKANVGVVKVPDPRVDSLAAIYQPKKTTYAEINFTDLGGKGEGIDRSLLNAMRPVEALCQVVRAFPDATGAAANPAPEIAELETETILADLAIAEPRVERLERDRSNPRELELQRRVRQWLEDGRPLRSLDLSEEERSDLSGYTYLSLKPLLVVLNVAEEAIGEAIPGEIESAAEQGGLGLVVLSAQVEMDVALLPAEEQAEFAASLGLSEPAVHRFIRSAYSMLDLISMLTVGPDECRAWPIRRGAKAPQAAGKIHSDIERGFIRAETIDWSDLVELGSESSCRDAGKLRVEGKDYVVRDGDVINFRFNV